MIGPLHIAIVGYGTAGQACALPLSRDGHRIEVFERVAQAGPMALVDALALRDALRGRHQLAAELQVSQQARRSHFDIYHFWSRWLTPLFQSDRDLVARVRDAVFLPLGRNMAGVATRYAC
jgi:2-polyprenyl-6-methoxyphenol hydroxylase-like FAD-dependent oxidoreductase